MDCVDISGGAKGPQNYIFGYGSLIEDESRRRTTPSAVDAWPARVKGIRRGWWARGAKSGLTTTYLGAIDDAPPNKIAEDLPTAQFPMVQSYVDICIHGCLEVEGRYPTAAGFTQDFIATTDEWSKFWVNDRLYPRRPFIFQPAAGQIDAALQKAPRTANLFYEAEIEPARWEDLKPVRP